MPQIQGYDPQGGFGAQFGAALGGGISQGLSASLNQMLEQKQNKRALSGLSPFLEQLDIPKEQIEQIVESGANPQMVAQLIPHLQKNHLAKQKEALKMEGTESSQKIFNEMADLLHSGDLGLFGTVSRISSKGRERRANFDALRPKFYSAIRKLEQSGHLNREDKLELLKSIPSSNDTEATIIGKMKAIADTLDIDPSILYEDSSDLSQSSSFKQGQSFDKMPSAAEAGKGAIIEDDKGNEFISNGTKWTKRKR
jgi:hypothetical protein